jgi:hypothetical protein
MDTGAGGSMPPPVKLPSLSHLSKRHRVDASAASAASNGMCERCREYPIGKPVPPAIISGIPIPFIELHCHCHVKLCMMCFGKLSGQPGCHDFISCAYCNEEATLYTIHTYQRSQVNQQVIREIKHEESIVPADEHADPVRYHCQMCTRNHFGTATQFCLSRPKWRDGVLFHRAQQRRSDQAGYTHGVFSAHFFANFMHFLSLQTQRVKKKQ